MGKSTAASLLSNLEVPVVDTDVIARQLVEPGQPALNEIQQSFGAEIVDANGHLRRDELARRVFPDPAARNKLETILHPRIREAWLAQTRRWRAENHPVSVVVIPLMFEVNADVEFDAIVCVACSTASQLERLRTRGWTETQIEQRIQAQWPVQRKMARSDFIVWSEGELSVHLDQLKRILETVKE